MSSYQRIKAELEQMREALRAATASQSLPIIYYEADHLRSLPEEQGEEHIRELIAAKQAEREARSPYLRSRNRAPQQQEETWVILPAKGSYTVDITNKETEEREL